MWHRNIGSSWMCNAGTNSFSVQLPSSAKNNGVLVITCEAPHITSNHEPFILHDQSGLAHQLPLIIKTDDFANFSSFNITGGCSDPKQYFKISCIITGWPKELRNPIKKFRSITTVEISPSEELDMPYYGRYRKKGTDKWIEGTLITFDSSDEIYECQVYYKLNNHEPIDAIYSPITDITCMWKSFVIESEANIDLEKLINKTFSIHFNPNHFYNTQYKSTLKLIAPADNENYGKEIVVKSVDLDQVVEDFPLIPEAQYEYKMTIMNLNVSYAKIFTTSVVAPVDNALWIKHFGDVDQRTLTYRACKRIESWADWETGERNDFDVDISYRYLTIKKNGFWEIKHEYQAFDLSPLEEKARFGGTFTLFAANSGNLKIKLVKVYSSKAPKPLWSLKSSQMCESVIQRQVLPALQLQDIIKYISRFVSGPHAKLELRLVCKNWCLAIIIPDEICGTISATSAKIFGFEYSFEESRKER